MLISDYKIGKTIIAKNKMDKKPYKYTLSAKYGDIHNPDSTFIPDLSPKDMLELGVFEGKYICDCKSEFPNEWYKYAKLSPKNPNINLNYFGIKSRQSLKTWKENGWIIFPDNRGWFQWYCRFYIGRRIPDVDKIQIKRWKQFARHLAQIKYNCAKNDVNCRIRQRQALLQWAYNPFI